MELRWEYSPPEGEEPSSGNDVSPSARRWRLVLLIVGLAVAGLIVGLSVGSPFWRIEPGRHQEDDADTGRRPPQKKGLPGAHSPSAGLADRPPEPPPASPRVSFETLKQGALDAAERLLERFPESVDALALMAEVQDTLFGNSDEAMKYWQMCLQRDRGCAEAYQGMAMVAFKKGDNEQAASVIRDGLETNPTWCDGRILLARALMGSGEIEEAARVLEENLKTSPESVESLFLLGRAYLQLREYEKAKERLLTAIDLDPQGPNLYHQLATACMRLGQKEEAERFREKFTALKSAMEERGRLMRHSYPDLNIDLEVMRERTAWIHVRAGKAYYLHGFPDGGAQEWARAAELDPVCRREWEAIQREFGRKGQPASAPPVQK